LKKEKYQKKFKDGMKAPPIRPALASPHVAAYFFASRVREVFYLLILLFFTGELAMFMRTYRCEL